MNALRCGLRGVVAFLAALQLAACNRGEPPGYQGYVEGEFVYLASPVAGYLDRLDAARGARVVRGEAVFALRADLEQHSLNEAEARERSAREKLANLREPRRPSEIAALEAQWRAAEAARDLSASQLKQQESLAARGFISNARLDEARTAARRDAAAVDSAREQIATYRASLGRQSELLGARADVDSSLAQIAQKRWQVDTKQVSAPESGEIAETYYRPGEWVAAGQPVASLLPDNRRRIRFFVPETRIAGLSTGQAVEATCDGCTAPVRGTIDFIAAQAEYTPPVIYSRGTREKLIFRVEAAPTPEQASTLRPGLPLDVRIAEPQ